MAKRLTQEQKDLIIELKGDNPNMTWLEIAAKVGCSGVTASAYYKKLLALQEETEEETSEEPGKTVEEYLQMVIDAKDQHIQSLEKAIQNIALGLGARRDQVQ